jgi:hypothetical protein
MAKNQSTIIKPLYAVAGATEVAYQLALGYANEAQKSATNRLAEVQDRVKKVERDPKALQSQARGLVNARVEELTKDAKDAQARFEARLAQLQKDAKAYPTKVQKDLDEAVADLAKTYSELVERGEKLVAAIRKDGVKAVNVISKLPAESTVARRERAVAGQGNVTTTTKGESKTQSPAKATAKKATTAKKTTAKKATTAKTAAAKKAPATKAPAAKKAPAKKTA